MDTIGDKITNLRKERHISQEQLGFELGVSTQTIHNWEKCKSEPSAKNIEALCSFFSVSSDYFFSSIQNPIAFTEDISKNNATEDCKPTKKAKKKYYRIFLLIAGVAFLFSFISVAASIYLGLMLFDINNGYDYISTVNVNISEFIISIVIFAIVTLVGIIFIILYNKYKVLFKEN